MSVMVITTPDELRAIVADEVSKAIVSTLRTVGALIDIDGMAARYDVSRGTIFAWLKRPGKLPPRRAGAKWFLSDVEEWDRHRSLGAL